MPKIVSDASAVNFSIEEAAKRGYKIRLADDGCAQVLKEDGTAYHVNDFECDCPDSWNRNGGSYELPDGRCICKHVALLLQFYPCPVCNSVMMQTEAHFQCLNRGCSNAIDERIVTGRRNSRGEPDSSVDPPRELAVSAQSHTQGDPKP